jgi:hypothetical protein
MFLAKDWQYNDADEMIRDRIVFATNSSKIQEKLINERDKLTLDKAIQITQNHELSQEQLKSMENATQEVHAVAARGRSSHRRKFGTPRQGTVSESRPSGGANHSGQRSLTIYSNEASEKPTCPNCGYKHTKKDKCPAQGQTCKLCSKPNHFAKVCRSARKGHEIYEPWVPTAGAEYPLNASNDNFADLFVYCISNVYVHDVKKS